MVLKKFIWAGHVMRRADNRWSKVTEWQLRKCESKSKQKTRWRGEIRAFAGAGWSTLTPDRGPGGESRLEHLPGQDGVH